MISNSRLEILMFDAATKQLLHSNARESENGGKIEVFDDFY
jgi:hypothetical protein